MSEPGHRLGVRALWAIDALCISLPVATVLILLAGAATSVPGIRHAGYTLVMVEIEAALYLCLASLLAFVAGLKLRAAGPAAYAAYGLLLNALGLWLAWTPTVAR